jgi:predicted transcriptional regulator
MEHLRGSGESIGGDEEMSKAVMLSIRPKWCEKICGGEKTIEVRKTRPKLDTPFKCYIYCTLPKYPHEDFIATNYPMPQFYGGGKVVGEFTCDRIFPINVFDNGGIQNWFFEHMERSCLTYEELAGYIGNGETGYGWHISDLRIYDEPRELIDFERPYECNECDAKWATECNTCHEEGKIKRAPQSWCYVEAKE